MPIPKATNPTRAACRSDVDKSTRTKNAKGRMIHGHRLFREKKTLVTPDPAATNPIVAITDNHAGSPDLPCARSLIPRSILRSIMK